MRKVHIIILMLVSGIIFNIFPDFNITVSADEASGKFKNDVSWSISGNVLTVSGNGEMGDVKYQPYSSYSGNITEIIVEEGVASIGYGAFSNFSALRKVQLPESLEYIDVNAFSYCYNLYDINIPDSVIYIGNNAFFGAYFLSSYTGDFIILGNGILYSYKGTDTDIVIPDGVTSISDRVFVSKNITSVHIPESVYYIGAGAFLNCPALKSVTVPRYAEYIGENAFGYTLNPAPEAVSNFILYGFPDTQAQFYAENNGISFIMKGDADSDGSVNSYDALCVLQYVSELTYADSSQRFTADMDGDGNITSYDALLILQYSVGL